MERPTNKQRSLAEIYDPLVAAELRRIELRTKRNLSTDLIGNYRSAFRGSGLVFSDIREYQPGDDIKHIHWKVTARTGRVYVKSYEEDRQLNIVLLVDISSSTDFGSAKSKHVRALEFASLIAILADKNHDSLGLCLFSDDIKEFLPPGKAKNQLQHVLFSLLVHRELQPGTNMASAIEYLNKHMRRPGVIFIVSDFFADNFEDELRRLAIRNDVVCVLLEDRIDGDLPRAGIIEFVDAESGKRCLVDTSHPPARDQLVELYHRRIERLQSSIKRVGADLVRIVDNPLQPLADLMRRRTGRLR